MASSAVIVFFSNSDCDIARAVSGTAHEAAGHSFPEIAGANRGETAVFQNRTIPSPWPDAAPASSAGAR